MNSTDPTDPAGADARLDRAIDARLGRLRTMPVDTSRLERALLAQIPRPGGEVEGEAEEERQRQRLRIGGGRATGWSQWFRPLRAVAASFVLLSAVVAVLLLSSSSGPALASAAQMAQMHEDLVSGRTPVMQVDSIEQANQMLAGQSPGGPTLPDAPQSHVMACCMKSIKNKKVACVLLKNEGEPVTMTVANATDMRLPKSPTVTRGGVAYHVQASGGLQMVMTERNGRWVCLIARMPAERLMDLAAELKF